MLSRIFYFVFFSKFGSFLNCYSPKTELSKVHTSVTLGPDFAYN